MEECATFLSPPAQQALLLNQKIPPGILLGLSSSSNEIKDFNSQTAKLEQCKFIRKTRPGPVRRRIRDVFKETLIRIN
jgi:hypothetical protein